MLTKKQIEEMYKGKKFDAADKFSIITTISFYDNYAILMSGHYDRNGGGYYVEACIDRQNGQNVIEGHCRPCDDKNDAVDVAFEMIEA